MVECCKVELRTFSMNPDRQTLLVTAGYCFLLLLVPCVKYALIRDMFYFRKALKNSMNLNSTQRSSPYRTVNTLCLRYKNQSVNAVWGKIAASFQIHTKHINTVCGQNVELLKVKLVVHILTTRI
jgi:hypothetical protein